MPRSACARATARLTVKWLDHRYHHGRSVKTLRIIKLLTLRRSTTRNFTLCLTTSLRSVTGGTCFSSLGSKLNREGMFNKTQ
jgi:hypothetical protein